MLDNFSVIEVETPVDKIIGQIRDLISSGQLKPGDMLPSERKLSEKLAVGRSTVRAAIQKLEFYGILKTMPQSGTVIAGLGISALEGLISNVLQIEDSEFDSLVETREILEINCAIKAARFRTEEDILELKKALTAYEDKLLLGEPAVEEDLLFHLKIAEAAKNSVLKSLLLIITPDIVNNYVQLKVCDDGPTNKTVMEHRKILQCIIDQDSERAEMAMKEHLKDVVNFSHNQNQ